MELYIPRSSSFNVGVLLFLTLLSLIVVDVLIVVVVVVVIIVVVVWYVNYFIVNTCRCANVLITFQLVLTFPHDPYSKGQYVNPVYI